PLHDVITTLRAALAAQPAEPVAWYSAKVDDCITNAKKIGRSKVQPWDAEHYDAPLYAAPPAQPVAPPGYALVPVEPYPSQRIAWAVALMKASHSDLDATTDEVAACYRAMIDAAPEQKPIEAQQAARRTAEYWKAEHLAGNAEIERLQERVKVLEAELAMRR